MKGMRSAAVMLLKLWILAVVFVAVVSAAPVTRKQEAKPESQKQNDAARGYLCL